MKKCLLVFIYLTPAIISLLLIGAHALRSGHYVAMLFCLLLLMSLCIREPLVARIVQFALIVSAAEWLHVAAGLIATRLEAGLAWGRLALIFGAVFSLSLAAIALFWTAVLKEMYHLSFDPDGGEQNKEKPQCSETIEPSLLQGATSVEQRQKLLTVHYFKITLATCSLLSFLLMEFSMGAGMVTLVAWGLVNSAIRTKLQRIGGLLSAADREKLFVRQTWGLCLLATPIIGYYSYSLPSVMQPLIVSSIIAVFTILLWGAARFEYIVCGKTT